MYLRGKVKTFNGKRYGSWTREGSKNAAIAEKKTQRHKGHLVRIVKAPTYAGKAGFYDIYIRKQKK